MRTIQKKNIKKIKNIGLRLKPKDRPNIIKNWELYRKRSKGKKKKKKKKRKKTKMRIIEIKEKNEPMKDLLMKEKKENKKEKEEKEEKEEKKEKKEKKEKEEKENKEEKEEKGEGNKIITIDLNKENNILSDHKSIKVTNTEQEPNKKGNKILIE